MIKAVTFDWWHTIAEPHKYDPVQGDARAWEAYAREVRVDGIAAVLRLHDIERTPEALGKAYDDWTEGLKEIWAQDADLTADEQVLEYLEAAGLADRATPGLLLALEEPIGAPLVLSPPALYPDFGATAKRLRESGLAVGLISNTGRTWGRFIRQVLKDAGLLDAFDACIFSDEARHRKPSPRIFHAALQKLGTAPEEVVHVGDDAAADIRGCQAAGMRGVFVDRGRDACDFEDARIHSFSELPEVLRRW